MTLIEDLLDLQFPESVKISPNCQQVVYSTSLCLEHRKGEHELHTIWLAETGHPKSSRQLTSGLFCDHGPRWCPEGNSIAFMSDRAKQGESWAIYMLPTKGGGEPYPLTPTENERNIDGFDFSPDGKFIAYLSADEKTAEKKAKDKENDDAKVWGEDWPYQRLRLVHVSTKKVTTLVSSDAHVVDLAWSDDGSKIAIAEMRTPDIESQFLHGIRISVVDISNKSIKEVCTFPNAIENLAWAGDTLYFLGNVYPESVISAQMVYSIDLKAETPTYVPCAHGKEDCAWEMSKVGKDIAVYVQHGMEDQIRILNGHTLFTKKKQIQAWNAAFTTDSDEMILAIVQGDTSSPPEVFTTTASGGAMVQLSDHGNAIVDHKFGTALFLRCPAADDGTALDAVYLTPGPREEIPDKPLATVVFIHGGPYNRLTDTFNPAYHMWTPLLLNAGYGVLLPNYRGGSGRGEDFAAYARGKCGTHDYEDIITLTNHAIEEGYADKEKLLVSGWSQGGFLSFIACVRNGKHPHGWKFKAAIPGAGVSDADTMTLTSDIGAFQKDLADLAPWESDQSDVTGRTGSPIWEFKDAAKEGRIPPMLILHGENDKRVPIEQSIAFRRALESVDAPFEMVVYPREPHLFEERKHIVDMAERVLRFVDMHIGGRK